MIWFGQKLIALEPIYLGPRNDAQTVWLWKSYSTLQDSVQSIGLTPPIDPPNVDWSESHSEFHTLFSNALFSLDRRWPPIHCQRQKSLSSSLETTLFSTLRPALPVTLLNREKLRFSASVGNLRPLRPHSPIRLPGATHPGRTGVLFILGDLWHFLHHFLPTSSHSPSHSLPLTPPNNQNSLHYHIVEECKLWHFFYQPIFITTFNRLIFSLTRNAVTGVKLSNNSQEPRIKI